MDALTFNFNPRPLTVLDLCCGAGLASLALKELGFDIYAGADICEPALEVWSRWAGSLPATYSVEELAGEYDACQVDVVVCGPPCQDDSRLGKMHADKGRGALKSPTFQAALNHNPTWIVMEMNSTEWLTWCKDHGARQTFKLVDQEQGGYTLRKRWFAVWGPSDLEIAKVPEADRKGWGDAFGFAADADVKLVSESIGLADRERLARTPDMPGHSVIGHGTSHVLTRSDGYRERLSAQDEAALQGYPELDLNGLTREEAQTAVGNGWAKSFGLTIGRAIQRAMAGCNPDAQDSVGDTISGRAAHRKAVLKVLRQRRRDEEREATRRAA